MSAFVILVIFLLGLIVGSFLNVVILRWGTGMSAARGRSMCFSCGKELAWYELVPLFSFLVQSGRCRGCRTKISWQYPLVEAATGAAFVVAYYAATSLVGFVLTAALLCVYIIIVTYDARHKIIPDFFSYLAAFISLGLIGATWLATGSIDPYRVIAGPALFLFFWAFWYFSKGTWMGLGDGKLALSIGWALGLSEGVAALLFSFWIGAIISLAVIGVQKLAGGRSSASRRLGMKSEIPFGPFLIIGFLIVFIWHVDIQAILSYLAV